jgi:hypothetical protein
MARTHHLGSSRFDEFPYPLGPVCAPRLSITTTCPSEKASVPKSARRKPREGCCVCGSLNAHRLSHSMQTHRGDQRQVLASVLGHLALGSYSPLGARDLNRSIEICVPLSSTNTRRLTVEARNEPSPQSSRSLIAFLGYGRLFLSGHPPGSRAMLLRLIVASETSTPLSSSKASQCSLKVRSGLETSAARGATASKPCP